MGDRGSDYNKGYDGGGWTSDTDMAAYNRGQWNRRLDDEAAARGAQRGSGGSTGAGTGGGEGGGMGVVLLLGLAAIGALVVLLMDYLIAMVVAIVALAAIFRLALPTTGPRPGWRLSLGSAAVAYLIVLAACVMVVGGTQLIVGHEDLTWMPAVQKLYLDEGTGHYVVHSGLQSFLIPWSVGLVGALWWLNRKLPPLRFAGAARIALFAALLTIVYIAALNIMALVWP
ncbi:MAG: hypothetical protein C0520_08455 [Sphingopyxis sp.]|nr:hypothetical protein [Sphingopyxis sp.]